MRLTFFAWQYSFSVTSPVLYSRLGELSAEKNYEYIISQQTQTKADYFYMSYNSAILPYLAMVRKGYFAHVTVSNHGWIRTHC
jgi:hypothetical protein